MCFRFLSSRCLMHVFNNASSLSGSNFLLNLLPYGCRVTASDVWTFYRFPWFLYHRKLNRCYIFILYNFHTNVYILYELKQYFYPFICCSQVIEIMYIHIFRSSRLISWNFQRHDFFLITINVCYFRPFKLLSWLSFIFGVGT